MKVIAGKKRKGVRYQHVTLEDTVGKTIEAVSQTEVDGAFGHEPCIVLHFTDGTKHGFVLPTDQE